MKDLINGLITAFSMYSKIPMPQIAWSHDTMKYSFCFFPLVGALIGGLVYGWSLLCAALGFNGFLFSAGMVVIPFAITGGLHLDGFIDTSDALYSRQEMERKLEILKDPHVGAFGVMMCVVYFILQFGIWGQFYENPRFLPTVALGYLLSRTLCGYFIVSFKTARNTGLAHIFSNNADKKTIKIVMGIYAAVLFWLMLSIHLIIGGIVVFLSIAGLFLYKDFCYREFGGITGDLSGCFLQGFELVVLLIAMIGGVLW